jgi:hypothetical protein
MSQHTDHQTIVRAKSHESARSHNQSESASRTGHDFNNFDTSAGGQTWANLYARTATEAGSYAAHVDNHKNLDEAVKNAKKSSGDFIMNVGKERIKQQQQSMRDTAQEQEK